MALVILRNDDKGPEWKDAIQTVDPELEIFLHTEPHPREEVRMAAVWKHPDGSLENYPNLLGIHSMGAGVDFILDAALPDPEVPVMRVVDPMLTNDMAEYVLTLCLAHVRRLRHYDRLQQQGRWEPDGYRRSGQTRVGIMGLGELGEAASKSLVKNGFQCKGWTRTSHPDVSFPCFTGEEGKMEFLKGCDILVCLLPLTPETSGVLCADLFDALPRGAYLINAARGGHLQEADLLRALESGQLCGAALDVFQQEPLPKGHPFWQHPGIRITPHVASVSDPQTVSEQIVANYKALLKGRSLQNKVDRGRGY